MSRRDWYDRRIDKRVAVQIAEEQGLIADSMEFRSSLLLRVQNEEITIEEALAELAKVKREAKRNGKKTRAQVWRSA